MDTSEQLLDTIEKNQDEIISFCSEIVKISSENPPGDTTNLVDFITDYLKQQRFDYEIHAPQKHMPNIVARTRGTNPGKRLIYNGHLDTYPCGDASRWELDPLSGSVSQGRIYGRGASDMKGGVTASVMAFTCLAQIRKQWSGEIVMTLVSDEETGGTWGTTWLLDNIPLVTGDAMINGEPTSCEQVSFAEKGMIFMAVKAKGIGAHGAYTHMGDNAIKKMMRFLDELEELEALDIIGPTNVNRTLEQGRQVIDAMKGKGAADVLLGITVNFGTISGGLKVNMVPEGCEAEVDIRLPQGVTLDQIFDEIDQRAARHPGISYEISQALEPNYTSPDHHICQLLKKAAGVAKGAPVILSSGIGASDARLFRKKGIPCALFGPRSYNMAGTDEYITIEDLIITTKAHALASLWYLQEQT